MKTDALDIHEHIRLEAFLLSEQAGHPTGMDETFWVQAEAIVHGRTAVVAGAGKSTKTKAKIATTAKPAKKPVAAPIEAKASPKNAVLAPKTKASVKAKTKPTVKRKK